MEEYALGIPKGDRVLFWAGFLSRDEVAAKLAKGDLPAGIQVYKLEPMSYRTEKKVAVTEVDHIIFDIKE